MALKVKNSKSSALRKQEKFFLRIAHAQFLVTTYEIRLSNSINVVNVILVLLKLMMYHFN